MLELYYKLFNYYFIVLVIVFLYASIVRYFKRPISKVLENKQVSVLCYILGIPTLFGYLIDWSIYSSGRPSQHMAEIFGTIVLVFVLVLIIISFLEEYRKNIPDHRDEL